MSIKTVFFFNSSFATSCDALLDPAKANDEDVCVCEENYTGGRCQHCGPGYYGEPEVVGDFCKPCQCNDNINVTDPDACDRVSGLCQKCLDHTFGDACERCEPWYFGDAVSLKNCQECDCDRLGTEECDHNTGECRCFPGVEGERCDRCMADHWGLDTNSVNGCTPCNCSTASVSSQCDVQTGQCQCQPGATGAKCERCQAGFWNLGPNGCDSCGCNTEFAVGGTCDQETGQCECLEGVIGQNCDHCPDGWVLVVNETRAETPEWKSYFDYVEGCFPCSSCVGDVVAKSDDMETQLRPIMREFRGVESSFFALQRLRYIENKLNALSPEISLLNPQEGARRLQPLEQRIEEQSRDVKSLNVDYKLDRMNDLKDEAKVLEKAGNEVVVDMAKVSNDIRQITADMQEIALGLGSGVTPDVLETAIETGNQWLREMKSNDFSPVEALAIEKQQASYRLVDTVKQLVQPADAFKVRVNQTGSRIKTLLDKLEDLKTQSEAAEEKVRKASRLNFENDGSRAGFAVDRILSMTQNAKQNNKMGTKLVNEAENFLEEALQAFELLVAEKETMQTTMEAMMEQIESDNEEIANVYTLAYEASNHAQSLEQRASELQNILENAKQPAARALGAANAYRNINEYIARAKVLAQEALDASEAAANMSGGVGEKADRSKDRTNELYIQAMEAKDSVDNELGPNMERAKQSIEDVDTKNKVTKQAVEGIIK